MFVSSDLPSKLKCVLARESRLETCSGKSLGRQLGCSSDHQAQPGQRKAFPGDKIPSISHLLTQQLHSLVPAPCQGATMPLAHTAHITNILMPILHPKLTLTPSTGIPKAAQPPACPTMGFYRPRVVGCGSRGCPSTQTLVTSNIHR